MPVLHIIICHLGSNAGKKLHSIKFLNVSHQDHARSSTFLLQMYSSGNPTNVENPIKDASCQVDIKTTSGRLTLYQTTLCEKISWNNLNANLVLDPGGYLGPYNKNDIQLICCQADASVLWLVPGVVQSRFIHSLDRNQNISVSFTWILTRDRPKGKEVVQYDRVVDPRDLPNPSDVQKVLNGSMNGFRIKNVYQRYFRVTGSGDVRPLEQEVLPLPCITSIY